MYDVVIIGGGITGTSIARELSRYKVKTVLIEERDDVAMGATKANSAIVHGGYAEAHAKLKGRLCYKGRTQFQKLDDELHFGFDPIGSMVLAFDDDQEAELEKLLENGKLNGLEDISIIGHDRILELDPLNEEALHQLLEHLLGRRRHVEARRRYEEFAARLREETGLEPQAATQALVS